jgi:acetyltransferase-like isoleucine patch superfamily enzyme
LAHRLRIRILRWLDEPLYTAQDFEHLGEAAEVDPGVQLSDPSTVSIGSGSAIYRGCTVLTGPGHFRMGAQSHLAGSVYVNALQSSVVLGDGVAVGPQCVILSYSNAVEPGVAVKDARITRDVRIGNDVFIGAGVVILPGVSIGDGAVIGAGAVVRQDVAACCIVAGVPARTIGHRR